MTSPFQVGTLLHTVVPGSAKLNNERFEYNDGTGKVVRAGISFNEKKIPYGYVVEAGAANYPDGHTYAGKPVLINGTSGIVMTIMLQTTLPQSSTPITGYLKNIEVTYRESGAMKITERPFTITIGKPLPIVILDEESTTPPVSSEDEYVDVQLKRTIKANQWSTICLPFDMSATQVKEAFGDDVIIAKLAENWSFEGSAPEVNHIDLSFEKVSAIENNIPFVILVTKAITEPINVKGVKIVVSDDPEEFPTAEAWFKKSSKKQWCYMIGTYVSDAIEASGDDLFIKEDEFFMANNLFMRSVGKSRIKGFRAKFQFLDNKDNPIVISEDAESRISMSFVEPNRINIVRASEDDDTIYNLSGQQVNKPTKKGLYITKGKKVVIK